MADPNRQRHPEPHKIPMWVKVLGVITLVVILLAAVVMLIGGGQHGPARHLPGGDAPAGATPPAGGHTSPAGSGDHTP